MLGGRRPYKCSCGILRFDSRLFPHLSKINIKQIFCLPGSFGEKMIHRICRLQFLKLEALETFRSLVIFSSLARWMPANLVVVLGKNSIHAELLLGSTAAAKCCLASSAGFRRLPKVFQASSRLLKLRDNISAWPSFFIFLAAILRITAFISKSHLDRWIEYFPTSRLQGLLENVAFSLALSGPFKKADDGQASNLERIRKI